VPKSKKVKVLTHRPRYIEPAVVPEFGVGSSSAAEATETASIAQSTKEATVTLKIPIAESVKDKVGKVEKAKVEEIIKVPKILSPPTEAKLPKVQKTPATTPKRRRMANVLDVVLETMKVLSPATAKKVAKATKMQTRAKTEPAETETAQVQIESETGPSVPIETEPAAPKEKMIEQIAPEKIEAAAPEASNKGTDYILRHAL
jgi:prophage DNA circulation protein